MPLQRANYQAVTEAVLHTLSPLFLHIFALLCISVFNISGHDALQCCSVAVPKFPFPLLGICQYY